MGTKNKAVSLRESQLSHFQSVIFYGQHCGLIMNTEQQAFNSLLKLECQCLTDYIIGQITK